MSRGDRDPVGAELIAELEAILARVRTVADDGPPALLLFRGDPPPTPLQRYAAELRRLCERVLAEADEETAAAFWAYLVETAARHGRRSGGRRPR